VTRVAIIGGAPLYREALERVLSEGPLAVIGTAATTDDGAELLRGTGPDVVLLQGELVTSYGALHKVRRAAEAARLVIVGAEDPELIALCASAGVVGFLPREATLADIRSALEHVARGEVYCPPAIVETLLETVSRQTRGTLRVVLAGLTEREQEVADLVGCGLSNKQIAQRLCIEVPTVKSHVHNILVKLHVARRSEAVAVIKGVV